MTRRRVSRRARTAYLALAVAASVVPVARLSADEMHIVWSDQPVVILPNQPKPQKPLERP